MEHTTTENMTPFDQLTSTQNLKILKLLIPHTPPENQRFLAIYTKFLELQHTIHFFQHFHNDTHAKELEKAAFSPLHLMQEIQPHLSDEHSEMLNSIQSMMDMISLFQTMHEGENDNPNADFDPMSMMKNLFTPEQQDMFDMYHAMSSQESPAESDETPVSATEQKDTQSSEAINEFEKE